MNWYALNTKPRSEQRVTSQLTRLGLEVLSPRLKRRKMVRRKMQTVTGPLFPGYIFARFDVASHLRAVAFARGVRRIVAHGHAPAPLDEEIISSIRARLDEGVVTLRCPTFLPGQAVRIEGGPLEGLEAVFEREISDSQRVVLLLRAIASSWRVVVPRDQVVNL